jgi:hypothetical protein
MRIEDMEIGNVKIVVPDIIEDSCGWIVKQYSAE